MKIIEADNFQDARAQFTGGYWAKLVLPFETWTLRPDGSIASVIVTKKRRKQ